VHMMDTVPSGKSNDMICSVCRYSGSDLRLVGCGCCVHAVSHLPCHYMCMLESPDNFSVKLRVRFGHLHGF
jgi:hypothetical protein